jgi:hypothetical protein
MADQGAAAGRPPAGARRQAPWPPPERTGTGRRPGARRGAGPRHALRPGTGPQPGMPEASPRDLDPGGAPQPAADPPRAAARTPARGFPPTSGRPSPPPGIPGPWHVPGPPAAAGGGYRGDGRHPGGQARPEGPGRRGGPGTRSRLRRGRVLLAAAVVLVLAAGGFAAFKYLYQPRVNAPVPSSLRLPTTNPGSPDFDKTLGKWQHIGTRAQDPQPLTVTELYPPRFALDGSSYVRAAATATTNCTLAVYGSRLQAALQSGHCSQVLRASYLSGTMMGTIGVVNLISAAAAGTAGKVTGPQQIIAPLSARKGPAAKLGNGTGVVLAEIKGHYLILMWAEFTDLKPPSTAAARQRLQQFCEDMLTGSANIALSTRMLTGHG